MKKGTPDTAPLPEPLQQGTDEQHGPALPLGERAMVLPRLYKGPRAQSCNFLRDSTWTPEGVRLSCQSIV